MLLYAHFEMNLVVLENIILINPIADLIDTFSTHLNIILANISKN